MKGRVHSFQSMGTLDGPGVRFVAFLQGCNLRCGCCHNPDTWACEGGTEYEAADVVKRAARFREYFGAEGGVTVSGGEPLLQSEFVRELFALCHESGLNTCLDTSGSILTQEALSVLDVTDHVLLDIKYTTDQQYLEHVGCGIDAPLRFLGELERRRIPTVLRQVTIPSLNDDEQNIRALRAIAKEHACVEKIELLPFKKICQVKYDDMGISFRFANMATPTKEQMAALNALLET